VVRASLPQPARLTLAAAAVLLAVLTLHYAGVGPAWPAWAEHVYEVIEGLAAACVLWRAFAHPAERAAWLAIGLGMLSFLAAEIYYSAVLQHADEVPYPSLADALYIGLYPACFAGLLLLVRARAGRLPWILWIDGVIIALGFVAVVAALLFHAIVDTTGGDAMTVATNLAYPMCDGLLLALVAGLIGVFGVRDWRAWAIVASGFALLGAADTVYLFRVAEGTYEVGGVLDAAWPAGMLIVAAAAWQRPRPLDGAMLDDRRFLSIPLAAGCAATALLTLDHYKSLDDVALWAATGCLLGVVLRLGVTFHQNASMLRASRVEASTDALTGLGNRRALLTELERRLACDPPEPAVLALFDLDGFKSYNDVFGHPAGDLLLHRLGARLAAVAGDTGDAYRMGGDEFCVIMPGEDADAVVARASAALSESGEGFGISASAGSVRLPHEARTVADALATADGRMYADKRDGRASAGDQTKDVLLRAVQERNPSLGQHGDEVAELARLTAERLGLDAETVRAVSHGAQLHDIGKLAIPDAVLSKAGPLDADEWAFMHRHTLIGARILSAAPALAEAAVLVRSSHERWDGTGYPDRLAAKAIPLGARVIAVCDAWDAMTTDRPYKRAMTRSSALIELERCAGTQFDPDVVAVFREVVQERMRARRAVAA
jgi:two-component system cell cycle response regulator